LRNPYFGFGLLALALFIPSLSNAQDLRAFSFGGNNTLNVLAIQWRPCVDGALGIDVEANKKAAVAASQ
jgi:hypothetical protein